MSGTLDGISWSGGGGGITLSNNKIVGAGSGTHDFGIIGGYGSTASLVISGNDISGTSNNAILLEKHAGTSNITLNAISVPNDNNAAIFLMTYDNLNISAAQVVHKNTISLPSIGTGSNAVAFDSATDFASDNRGRYTNVAITENTVTGVFGRTAIGLYDWSSDGTSGGVINAVVKRNSITGTGGGGGGRAWGFTEISPAPTSKRTSWRT